MLTAKDYQAALDVQDACNLSGVVHSFAEVLPRIREEANDTDKINRHPISVMYASKIAHLSECDVLRRVNHAYDVCKEKAKL